MASSERTTNPLRNLRPKVLPQASIRGELIEKGLGWHGQFRKVPGFGGQEVAF